VLIEWIHREMILPGYGAPQMRILPLNPWNDSERDPDLADGSQQRATLPRTTARLQRCNYADGFGSPRVLPAMVTAGEVRADMLH
jgi:hypothetical protein